MYLKKNYPYYNKGKFHNNRYDVVRGSVLKTVILYVRSFLSLYHCYNQQLPLVCDYTNVSLNSEECYEPVVIPMGHATVLIMYRGINILCDPIFGSSSIFFKRYVSCTPSPKSLPQIDYVLLSHDHPDHCDIASLKYIKNNNDTVEVFTPLNMKNILHKNNIYPTVEKTWWQSSEIKKNDSTIKFTCLPALHWSQHGLLTKRNSSLWCSWMIELDEHVIYFAGDSAYGEHYQDIANFFPRIDCALLPIAPYTPEKYQLDSHMSSEQIIQTFIDLKAHMFVPIHWGVFRLGLEPLMEPLNVIVSLMQHRNMLHKLHGIAIGDRVNVIHKEEKNYTLQENSHSDTMKKHINNNQKDSFL